MKTRFIILLFFFMPCFMPGLYAQFHNISALVKAGNATFNDDIGGFGGEGLSSYRDWINGRMLSAGIELPVIQNLDLQILFTYSDFDFDESRTQGIKVNKAKNRVYDLMGELRYKIGFFYLIGGAGISYQKGDAVSFQSGWETFFQSGWETMQISEVHYKAKDRFGLGSLLGIGVNFRIYKPLSLIAEADLNFREYMGTSLLLGARYSFNH